MSAAATTLTGFGATPERALSDFAPDAVHVHNTFPNWGTRWLGRWHGRTVITVHNFRPMCAAGTLFRHGHNCTDCLSVPALPAVRYGCYRGSPLASVPLAIASSPVGPLRKAVGVAARVITLNEQARKVYSDVLGRPVDLVPNFVPSASRQQEPTRGWAYVGRLTQEKGIRELLEAWPAGESLDIVGNGPLANEVASRASHHPTVHLVGQVSRDQLLERLGTYRGLLVPSLWVEGLPTIVLEAMARGVPSILSRHVAASTSLEQAGAAVVFDPGAGADAVSNALRTVTYRGGALRAACVDLHSREYAPTVWQRRMDAIYEEVRMHHGVA